MFPPPKSKPSPFGGPPPMGGSPLGGPPGPMGMPSMGPPPMPAGGPPVGASLPPDSDDAMGDSPLLQALAASFGGEGQDPLASAGTGDPNMGAMDLLKMLSLGQAGVGGPGESPMGGPPPMGMPGMPPMGGAMPAGY